MSKRIFQVVEVIVQPGQEPQYNPIKANLSRGKADLLRESLENKQIDFDPNKVISYLVQPSN